MPGIVDEEGDLDGDDGEEDGAEGDAPGLAEADEQEEADPEEEGDRSERDTGAARVTFEQAGRLDARFEVAVVVLHR